MKCKIISNVIIKQTITHANKVTNGDLPITKTSHQQTAIKAIKLTAIQFFTIFPSYKYNSLCAFIDKGLSEITAHPSHDLSLQLQGNITCVFFNSSQDIFDSSQYFLKSTGA